MKKLKAAITRGERDYMNGLGVTGNPFLADNNGRGRDARSAYIRAWRAGWFRAFFAYQGAKEAYSEVTR